jgi:HlyD family secretion protein
MKKSKLIIWMVLLAALAGGVYYFTLRQPGEIILTGMVTTDEVIVSSEIQGRLQQLLVREGDVVTNRQLLGVIQPQTQQADVAFYASGQQQSRADLAQAKADLVQLAADVTQAQANVAQTQADAENARLNFERIQKLYTNDVESVQVFDQTRMAYESAKARVDSAQAQVVSAQARIVSAQARIESAEKQIQAAGAQTAKALVYLDYTKIIAPTNGVVDTRAALPGEVVNPGQAIVTLIDQDDLWVRADVEESYIDGIPLGKKLMVKLPSGEMRAGTVFYRGVDADYATQRDVSRTKRDIKTFEIRLRCDNADRGLAVGMTAYVTLPVAKK